MILVSGTSFKVPSICSKRWITLLKATQLFDFIIKIGEGHHPWRGFFILLLLHALALR